MIITNKKIALLFGIVLWSTLPAENTAQGIRFNGRNNRPNNAVAITDTVRLAIALPVSIVTTVLLFCACGACYYRRRHQQAFARHQPPPPRRLMYQSAIHTPVNQPSATASQPPTTQPPEQQQEPTDPELTSTEPPSYNQAKDHTTITLNGESASPPMTTLPSYEDLTIVTADNSSEALSPQPQQQGETNWVTSIQVVIGDGNEATVGEQHTSEEHVEPREQDSAM